MRPTARDVLIVVDVQNDFVSGSMAIPGAKSIVAPINRLAEAFDNVVVVQDWHPPGHISFASAHPGARPGDMVATAYGEQKVFADHCVQGTDGAALDPDLRLDKAQLVLRKGYKPAVDSLSAFYENDGVTPTGLSAYLRSRGLERVFCVGLARYGCVMLTAEGAVRDGFRAVMVDDACKDVESGGAADREAARRLAALGVERIASDAVLRRRAAVSS